MAMADRGSAMSAVDEASLEKVLEEFRKSMGKSGLSGQQARNHKWVGAWAGSFLSKLAQAWAQLSERGTAVWCRSVVRRLVALERGTYVRKADGRSLDLFRHFLAPK
jgi:hypothetical protein